MADGIKNKIKKGAIRLYKELTLHRLFPLVYRRQRAHTGTAAGRVVFLEEYHGHLTDNCAAVYRELKKRGQHGLEAVFLHREDRNIFRYTFACLRAVRKIAQSKAVFLDDSSELVSCLPIDDSVQVVQLWHACGAFKKFGYSLEGKKFGASKKELERFPRHRNFSVVTVSSPEVAWAYAEAFHMEEREDAIRPLGIARTDVFFKKNAREAAWRHLKELIPAVKDRAGVCQPKRRIVLYAPTFRGSAEKAVSPDALDFSLLRRMLGPDWLFLIKHHPYVKNAPAVPEECRDCVVDVSDRMQIHELLLVSDVCISDYSSLVFEYSLLGRPILFFAPDLNDYYDWRGFYYPYQEMTPGPVLKTTEEVGDWLAHLDERFDPEMMRSFRQRFMSACDGHSTERIADLVTGAEMTGSQRTCADAD